MSKVLFLDIDGVLLPGRAYTLPNQTKPIVKTFDPCAVAMLNEACRVSDRKIVIHSSWIRQFWGGDLGGDVHGHCIAQGVDGNLFHEDLYCNREMHWRYDRVREWLARHKEVTDFVIVDDEPVFSDGDQHLLPNLVLTDFNEGITVDIFKRLRGGEFPRN